MNQDTYLGFDYGTTRIGVAVGQAVTRTATPLAALVARNGKPDWNKVKQLIAAWQPKALVIGLPLNLEGESQEVTKGAELFAEALTRQFGLPVKWVDERFTTKSAREILYDQGISANQIDEQEDSFAAKLILEDWLRHL